MHVSIPWNRDIGGFYEIVLLSSDNLDQIVARLNRILRPQGHFARLLKDEDGRVFFVTPLQNGDGTIMPHEVFFMKISNRGRVVRDGREVARIQPFPLQAGPGELRDGRLTFSHIRQRATVLAPRNGKPHTEAPTSIPPLLCYLCHRPLALEPSTGDTHDRCAAQASRQ